MNALINILLSFTDFIGVILGVKKKEKNQSQF
ncbi:Uncharacterised protein [Streptococcus pneumoniae]|nr:Uncharacterised protein [Streptococcus pneumoniae]COT11339.1 Uncharacterised protein [Streptococcus pneumoniae]COT18365.1 Uncharacterised protein [Streptococcus pneumoniae]CZE33474.1 Uncharacterised protein [Streptococcus pneumoniae]CZE37314.1 Uncharacterised protein [Streptococcus pneumoniae]